jgi:hypothetical protein
MEEGRAASSLGSGDIVGGMPQSCVPLFPDMALTCIHTAHVCVGIAPCASSCLRCLTILAKPAWTRSSLCSLLSATEDVSRNVWLAAWGRCTSAANTGSTSCAILRQR